MPELQELFAKFVLEIFGVAVVLLLALLISQVLKRLVNVMVDMKHVSPLIATRLHGVRRGAVMLMALLVILETLGVFRGAWALISTILAALALGFVAAWSVLSNATAAFLILTFRPFRVGDTVELLEMTNGYPIGGRVLDMNLLYTTLQVDESDAVPQVANEALTPQAANQALAAGSADAAQAPTLASAGAATAATQAPNQSGAGLSPVPPRLIRVPNNLFFQRPVRTRSGHAMNSKAPFFGRSSE